MGCVCALGVGEMRTQMMNRCEDHRKGCELPFAALSAGSYGRAVSCPDQGGSHAASADVLHQVVRDLHLRTSPMRDSVSVQKTLRRTLMAVAVLTPLLTSLTAAAVRAAEPPEPLTAEQRKEQARQLGELNKSGFQLHQRGENGPGLETMRQALKIGERLYPNIDYPDGHPNLANSLNAMGVLLQAQGAYGEARGYYQRALAMYEALYSRQQYPQGRPELATTRNNLGTLLQAQGAFGEARRYLQSALTMRQDLYPKSKYRHGHPELAGSLNNLGALLRAQGDYGEARRFYQRALSMYSALYPKQQHPKGRPELACGLNNLGNVLEAQGAYDEARDYYQRALAMNLALYPKGRYPQGHPELANSLNNLGSLLQAQGAYGEARGYYERALEMHRALYAKDGHPRGHPALAIGLNNLGGLLQDQGAYGEARGYYERALEMRRSLYPKHQYAQGHPELAESLDQLGRQLNNQGDYAAGRSYFQQALDMRRALFPKEKYPRGHPDLAKSLNNLGALFADQGAYDEARGYYERAREMQQAFFPKEQYPHGHPDLARILTNLGALLDAQGADDEAREFYRRALAMNQALHPIQRFPQGHPEVASSMNCLGLVLQDLGVYGEARGYYERAIEMQQALFPKEKYPRGHPDLAKSLNNLGALLADQGAYDEARPYYERALAIEQALYPGETFPQGHVLLAFGLDNLGALLRTKGAFGEALPFILQGADMQQDLADILLSATSETEAMNYLAQLPGTRDSMVSTSLRVPGSDAAAYARVWRGKAAVARGLQRRQVLFTRRAATDPATRRKIEAWRDTRSQLARLVLATSDGRDHPERIRRLEQLSAEKERYERDLAEAIPDIARSRALERSSHIKLVQALPERAAVLDLVRYTRFEQDPRVRGKKGEKRTWSFVGFVLAKGRPVRAVDLGPAAPIDEAVKIWRTAITRRQPSPAADILRHLVWEPLARQFASDTTTVVLALDGSLTAVPWAALPGERPGTVLLEQYALATVPHVPFLLDRLTAPVPPTDDRGILVAVGGVAYDQAPKPIEDEKTKVDLLAALPAETTRGRADGWKELPGTLYELNAVTQLAGERTVIRLGGTGAGTAQLIRELPRARWAHIATHGFFANPSIPSVLRPDPELFSLIGRERVGAGLRNPLVLSGLVLAGANRPSADVDGSTRDDLGILTAEAIAGLPLQDLELVVLSACETGLGLVGGGEGVFGLQRAFHLAGAHNVVASLWKVDDQATAALMAIFYNQLWRQNKPPIEALRTAQLTLYRHPELINKLAKARGTPDFEKLVQRLEPGPGDGQSEPTQHAPIDKWAAFVLSGWGK
jgi:tetratricopeptide (TPR) repeat protein/CHAT domain-containing protein